MDGAKSEDLKFAEERSVKDKFIGGVYVWIRTGSNSFSNLSLVYCISSSFKMHLWNGVLALVGERNNQQDKKEVVIHLASLERTKCILTLALLCGVELRHNDILHGYAGKVNVKDITTGRSVIGYILKSYDSSWDIQLTSYNIHITLHAAVFDNTQQEYKFPNTGQEQYIITQYWPNCIMILMRGEMKYTLNRIVFDNNNNIIPQHSS